LTISIYEGMTLGFVFVGIIFIILGFSFNRTKVKANQDDAAMEDEAFRKQVNLINEKVLELGDFHNFVKDEIEEKHKELLFLYQMIGEKEKSIKAIQLELERYQVGQTIEPEEAVVVTKELSTNSNQRIIELKDKGYSPKEIAQVLDIGIGEVDLVLNLYE